MFSVTVNLVCMDVRVKFGNSTSNRGWIIHKLPVGPIFCTYTQSSITVCNRMKAAKWYPAGVCGWTGVYFHDPRLNRSREIWPKAIGGGIFGSFFSNFHKCRQEFAGDVITDVAADQVGMNVHVKCGNSLLNKQWPNYSAVRWLHPFYVLLYSS